MTQAPAARAFRDPLPSRETLRPATPTAPEKPVRLVSLDAYRGLIMLALAAGAFGLGAVAKKTEFKDNPRWQAVAFQTDHVEWEGGTLLNLFRHDEKSANANRLGDWFGGGVWDLIQPSFMFMVGVAIPFSYAARRARGDSTFRVWLHVFIRAFVLVALGIFLRSTGNDKKQLNFTFEDVLTQIGLGYPIVFGVFLLGRRSGAWPLVFLAALAAILVGYWAYFASWPLPGPDFKYTSVGPHDGPWPWREGLFAHWNMNTNAAQWFDVYFLNLFWRPRPWEFNGGGYLTLNFIPSMATAIFGLIAAELLRSPWPKWAKFLTLLALSAACLVGGAFAGEYVCPIVKRIWTPSWAVYSAGWTFLILSLLYGVIDGIGFRWWAFPFVVVGMNSITMYVMQDLYEFKFWVARMVRVALDVPANKLYEWLNGRLPEGRQIPLGDHWYSFAGAYEPVAQATAIALVLWLICFWMYRQKFFVRI
jgi:heparan-alpha-glucosaminide N-acetyltransferase